MCVRTFLHADIWQLCSKSQRIMLGTIKRPKGLASGTFSINIPRSDNTYPAARARRGGLTGGGFVLQISCNL